MATPRPVRVMDPFAEEFWAFTQERQFRIQRCTACGKLRWPAAAICDRCLSPEYEWAPLSGKGRVLSWTVFRREYFAEYPAPHTALAVELDEGPIFICCMPPEFEDAELADGTPVELTWLDGEDRFGTYQLPAFKPVAG